MSFQPTTSKSRLLMTSCLALLWATAFAAPAKAGVNVVYTLDNPGQFQSVLGNQFATFNSRAISVELLSEPRYFNMVVWEMTFSSAVMRPNRVRMSP